MEPIDIAVGRPDEKEVLVTFVHELIKAFFKAGYYQADHPETRTAMDSLYRSFSDVSVNCGEVTFLFHEPGQGHQPDILIDGPLEEPASLAGLMLKGMADLYVGRFVELMGKKNLASLSFKSRMDMDEFAAMIDAISSYHADSRASYRENREAFFSALKEKRVHNFSVVYRDDVEAIMRKMSWRAKLALSRLRVDVGNLPVFHDKSMEELVAVRRQVVGDILRPLRSPELVVALMVNCDLASMENYPVKDVLKEIVNAVDSDLFVRVSRVFIDYLKRKLTGDGVDPEDVTEVMIDRMISDRDADFSESLRLFFADGLVALSRLPEKIQEQVMLEKIADEFDHDYTFFLDRLAGASNSEDASEVVGLIGRVSLQLVARNEFSILAQSLEAIDRAALRFEELSSVSGRIAQDAIAPEQENRVAALFAEMDKENRMWMSRLISRAGNAGIRIYLSVLGDSDDVWILKNACEGLLNMGPPGLNALLSGMEQSNIDGQALLVALKVLSETGENAQASRISALADRYCEHMDARIRMEAISLYFRFTGKISEKIVKIALVDPDENIKSTIVRYMGIHGAVSGMPHLLRLLRQSSRDIAGNHLLIEEACRAITRIENAPPGGEVEQVLMQLAQDLKPGLMDKLLHSGQELDSARRLCCLALSGFGTVLALPAVRDLAHSSNRQVKTAAHAAEKAITHREGLETSW